MLRPAKLTRVCLLCLALLPAGLILLLIAAYSLDFPFEDEWSLAPFFVKYARSTLTIKDLFAQQVEYRQFFPNLIIVTLGWLTRWNVRYEMLVSVLLACLTSFNIYRLGEATVGREDTRYLLAYVAANMMIFSPMQYENWLQGQQLIYFIPVACITTCLRVAYSSLSIWPQFALCMCLSTISSFSAANGLLCWVVVLPTLAWVDIRSDFARLKWPVVVWTIAFALSSALYFYGFQMPPGHTPGGVAVKAPYAILYFLSFIGSPLTADHRFLVVPAAAVGLTLLVLYLWLGFRFVKALPDFVLARRMLCWLSLGAFSVLTAIIVTFGRLNKGLGFSLSSRYKTFSLYLVVSLIYLLAIVWEERWRLQFQGKCVNRRWLGAAVASAFALYLLAAAIAFRHVVMYRTSLLQAKASVHLLNVVDYSYLQKRIEARCLNLDNMRDTVTLLDAMGFLRPSLAKSNLVTDARVSSGYPAADGIFERLTRQDEAYVAAGQAFLPHSGEPADAVLLAGENLAGEATVFALAEVSNTGDILNKLKRGGAAAALSWQSSFPVKALPEGTINLTAWAFDANTGQAYKLAGTHTVEHTH